MKALLKNRELLISKLCLICCDIFAVFCADFLALFLRFEMMASDIDLRYIEGKLPCMILTCIATLLIFQLFRLYSCLWRYAGAEEMVNIVLACMIAAFAHMYCFIIFQYPMPRSYWVMYGMFLLMLTVLSRYAYRFIHNVLNNIGSKKFTNVMMIGAGEAGNALIAEIGRSKNIQKKVVCVIDDNKTKKGSYIRGVRIVGDRYDIPDVVKDYKIDEIMVAVPSAKPKDLKEILNICKETGCELLQLPGIDQLVNGEVSVSKLKAVDVNDLLGREPVKVDLSSIMNYVSGKVVMVTGGGGSIGSELCRQIAAHNPKLLLIVDIYENSAYDIQQELKVKFPELNFMTLIASVRNTKRMDQIFEMYRPEIVYHAAAHKHVPLMEDSPNEAVKNNVLGTWKVVQAADKWKVKRFVMISTDKAVNPTNVMGATKRICEMIIQTYNRHSETEFVAVRFGNVLGSNGSVIPLFKKQIAAGGPVTVTHPDIIRYFMTIPEAVSLVLQAGAYAKGGEIFVLDMGEPVKILDLAKNLILLSGHKPNEDIMIEFTGLRPGEKLYEEMLMKEEGMQETRNKLIYIGKPIEMDEETFMEQLHELNDYVQQEPDDIRKHLMEIVPTYHPRQT
ncbi:MAG: polysaccharide biosynthesis protein [Lachnospiraceae bacterium]